MNRFNIKFCRKVNDEWILFRTFADLKFKNLEECENFALTFLRNKRKSKQITNSLKYTVEEI